MKVNNYSKSYSLQYHYWGKADAGKENFITTAKEILAQGGVRQLFVGTMATVQRDLVFGGVFALLRHEILPLFRPEKKRRLKQKTGFVENLIAGMAATILSSPLNYVRNVHYATSPSDEPKTTLRILKELLEEARREPDRVTRLLFLQHRLRIGWGTARVGCGMAVGAKIYELCSQAVMPDLLQ